MALSHYFKIAIRYLLTHKVFTAINILGLVTGISVCFFALQYVRFELSYDSYNRNKDHIYRLVTDVHTPAGIDYQSASAPLGPALQNEFPEVKAAARFFLDYFIVQNDHGLYSEENIAYADSSLFSVFTLPMISGDPRTALNDPFSIILSRSAAEKYFGSVSPIGHTLLINGKDTAHVTGVMKDIPFNSHFRADMLVSLSTLTSVWNPGTEHNWTRSGFYTYLLLPGPSAAERLKAQLAAFVNRHYDQSIRKYTLSLEPLTTVYLHGKPRGRRTGSEVTGNSQNIYIFSLLAVFVLFIACFNFINLTTAVSTWRAKEVGLRKVLGASRRQLIVQFLLDALLLTAIAFLLALLAISLLIPVFNQLTGKTIVTSLFGQVSTIALLLGIALLTGLLSGLYPALVLSAYDPLTTLKGRFATSGKGALLRKTLVVTQFTLSIILIIATIVVYQQLKFMQSHQLGFRNAHQLVIDFQFDRRIAGHLGKVNDLLRSVPGVENVCVSSGVPGKPNNKIPTRILNSWGEMQDFQSDVYFVDTGFLQQYHIGLVAGTGFSSSHSPDSAGTMLINEAAVKSLGYRAPAEAIGKPFEQSSGKGVITGVIRDFHFHSFREKVQPLTVRMLSGSYTFLTLDINTPPTTATIDDIKNKWRQLAPGLPLTWFFADETYDAQYAGEQQFGRLFIGATTLAIGLSCLGLFGLTIFSTLRRTKEVGIRKVLGASANSIIGLLTREFIGLVAIAFAIGAPIAAYGMHHWLAGFAYRTGLSWWIFALAGLLTMSIAILTIGFQTIRAALADPVKNLRTE
ncbi:MAG: ABC transporter permease [Bacteroidetes bacterium]|nr:ABC transporter permease [Bacteroidota bacterium]